MKAIVVNIQNKQAQVLLQGTVVPCILPGTRISGKNALAAGDFVEIEESGKGQYKLLEILPRKTALYRGNRRSTGEEVIIAANIQGVLAIVPAEYLLHQAGYLEAAIIATKRAGVKIHLFLSKWDLVGEQAKAILRHKLEQYKNTADAVFTGTAYEPSPELVALLNGKATVVIGERGCGKTTLIRALLQDTYSGNTPTSTSASILYSGAKGTYLIDTPGFRDFSLQKITEEEREAVFPEITSLAERCSFRNCTHTHEEGCRVLAGLRENILERARYDAYQKMGGNVPTVQKADYRHKACTESFTCKVCGTLVVPEGAGTQHRNHCPECLSSIHVDNQPGDRASLCHGIMEPVSVWVRKGGEWAIIHRCRTCGALSSNRIAADDNPALLLSMAVKPLAMAPFPLHKLEQVLGKSPVI